MERTNLHPMFSAPEIPKEPMEFLSRSWSLSASEVSKALAPQQEKPLPNACRVLHNGVVSVDNGVVVHEDVSSEVDRKVGLNGTVSGNPFAFASSETSQIVMDRIMSHSQEVSPRTSGRLSHSSGPGQSCGSLTDSSPSPVSPSEMDDPKYNHTNNLITTTQYKPCIPNNNGGKTVGRWLKDRREKKKEEARTHNAQLHAAVSVAGVASAVAAIAARTDMALASAATLVAAQCVEAAETLGAEREHLASVVGSAVNVRSASDIMTLTAAAATALRGAATLKVRALKDVWNVSAVIPVDKGTAITGNRESNGSSSASFSGELVPEENFLGICSRELLARGCELLKKTRNGDLHWKIVSVYINRMGQVMLKMKSRHVAGTVTKKKKNVVLEVLKDVPAWPGRHLLEGGDDRRYFGLKTVGRGLVEFECKDQREYDMWIHGVSRLLTLAKDQNIRHKI